MYNLVKTKKTHYCRNLIHTNYEFVCFIHCIMLLYSVFIKYIINQIFFLVQMFTIQKRLSVAERSLSYRENRVVVQK